MHLPALISDLALMLLTAACVTLIFKKLNQPLVLGYIVAGFLLSPYFDWLPTVMDTSSVETWKEIGIIVLMFYLGLEFNLHKLASVGGTGFITAMVEVLGMLLAGFSAGQLMGWTVMDSIFLGGMLSMSSTTIIIKAFDELGLKGKPFTELVFGTLVIEDIAGIFMMIVLSTISVSRNISGLDLAVSLLLLILYLALWLILGIFVLPTLLKRTSKLMSDETLLIFSLGICFGMVLLADALGFSSALGAFLAGSLLAGTVHAERVEHLATGVKDLFGAVFFLSVGMMVNPALLLEYWLPILIITVLTIVGKLIFSTCGFLLSGQSLENAVHGGFSLAQIGEFAFIIASLGESLGVTGDFLYPIVVMVSVLTTFTTPFCINFAGKAVPWLEHHLPAKLLQELEKNTDRHQSEKEQDGDWAAYFKRYFFVCGFYGVLMFGVMLMGVNLLLPRLTPLLPALAAKVITLALIYGVMALFVRPMLDRNNHTFTALWVKGRSFRLPLIALTVLRLGLLVFLAVLPLQQVFGFKALWLAPVLAAALLLIGGSNRMATYYLKFEARFLANFNERSLDRSGSKSVEWLDEQLYVGSFIARETENGQTLQALNWGRRYSVNVIRIQHGKKIQLMPGSEQEISTGDRVWVLAPEKVLKIFWQALQVEAEQPGMTLRRFVALEEEENDKALYCCAVKTTADAPFVNRTVRDSGIRQKMDCLLLGLQKDNYPVMDPPVDMQINAGDLIWVLGGESMMNKLAQLGLMSGAEESSTQKSFENYQE